MSAVSTRTGPGVRFFVLLLTVVFLLGVVVGGMAVATGGVA